MINFIVAGVTAWLTSTIKNKSDYKKLKKQFKHQSYLEINSVANEYKQIADNINQEYRHVVMNSSDYDDGTFQGRAKLDCALLEPAQKTDRLLKFLKKDQRLKNELKNFNNSLFEKVNKFEIVYNDGNEKLSNMDVYETTDNIITLLSDIQGEINKEYYV